MGREFVDAGTQTKRLKLHMIWISRGDGLELHQKTQHVGASSVDRPENKDQRIHKSRLCSLLGLKALVNESSSGAAISSNLQSVELAGRDTFAA